MNEAAKNLENIDILLAFSFDLVARITPGIAFLFVYFPPSVKDTSAMSLADGIMILMIAYLVGITVDIAANPVETLISNYTSIRLSPMGAIIGVLKNSEQPERFRITKLLAEAILFRSCAILCLPLFIFESPLIIYFLKHCSDSNKTPIFKLSLVQKFAKKYPTGPYYVCVIALVAVFIICHKDRRHELLCEAQRISHGAEWKYNLDQSAEAAHKLVGLILYSLHLAESPSCV
jgi:hypothetical protein